MHVSTAPFTRRNFSTEAERRIENLYKLVALTPEMAEQTRSGLRTAIEGGAELAKRTQKDLLRQQTRLMDRSKKLLDGHLDGTIPGPLYREEQQRMNAEMSVISAISNPPPSA